MAVKKSTKNVQSKKKVDQTEFDELKKLVIELLMVSNGLKPEQFDEEFKILYVVEGHSAASGLRSNRDARTHGILALQGKILNIWRLSLNNAMKAEVIKEYLTVIKEENYTFVVWCCDADPDGQHIRTLGLGVSVKFANFLLKEGKLLNCYTPLYTYHSKNGKLEYWSDTPEQKDGLTLKENKGLGSYNADSLKKLILYPQMGAQYVRFVEDREAQQLMDAALIRGCVDWVHVDADVV